MDTEELRRDVLRDFVRREGGHAKVVQKYRLTPSQGSYLSQLIAEGASSSFKERSAENWETRLRLPAGMLVRPDLPQQGKAPAKADEFTILQYEERGGAMGNGGLVLEDQPPGHIRAWRVDQEWLRLNVRHHSGVHNLRIVTGFGPSMRPMFNPGDPLLCDTGKTTVDVDGVYFFRVGDHGFIKILQRIPMAGGVGIRAKSKNPDYDPFDITPESLSQEGYFEVFGKILTVWQSEVL